MSGFGTGDTEAWGTGQDSADFDASWRERGCIGGNFGTQHHDFPETVAIWVKQADRQARIYKNDYTDGRWDPRNEANGQFSQWVRRLASTSEALVKIGR